MDGGLSSWIFLEKKVSRFLNFGLCPCDRRDRRDTRPIPPWMPPQIQAVCHECHECHALACLFHFRALVNVRVMCPPVSGLESLPVNSPSASMLPSKACASSAVLVMRAR